MGRLLLIALVVATSLALTPGEARATAPAVTDCCRDAPDFPTARGHFYTQASGLATNPDRLGFEIADEDGIPFWTAFQEFGGIAELGYPSSARFVRDGFVHQATQGAVLQWDPVGGRVRLVNVLDELSARGADTWLAQSHLVPKPGSDQDEAELSYDEIKERRLALLTSHPAIHERYRRAPDPIARYGLPVGPARDVGPAVALRTQRAVFYVWKERHPWAAPGEVTLALAGDLFKQFGLIPEEATIPRPGPPPRTLTSRGEQRPRPISTGIATWYGAAFHGLRMANGQRFDMYDPTTTASNQYPLGTRLRVTRIATGESIVVRVTDRGAFRPPILVDLSYAAFARLANPAHGVIRVTVEPLD